MAKKNDVIETLLRFQSQLQDAASRLPDDAWERQAYQDGWTARRLLAHIASTSGVAGFVLMLSRSGGMTGAPSPSLPSRSGGALDQDAWNQQQVDARRGRSVAQLLDEVRSNVERDAAAVQAATDDELSRPFRAPWGAEGTLASVIVDSVNGHLGMHLADLRSATARRNRPA